MTKVLTVKNADNQSVSEKPPVVSLARGDCNRSQPPTHQAGASQILDYPNRKVRTDNESIDEPGDIRLGVSNMTFVAFSDVGGNDLAFGEEHRCFKKARHNVTGSDEIISAVTLSSRGSKASAKRLAEICRRGFPVPFRPDTACDKNLRFSASGGRANGTNAALGLCLRRR